MCTSFCDRVACLKFLADWLAILEMLLAPVRNYLSWMFHSYFESTTGTTLGKHLGEIVCFYYYYFLYLLSISDAIWRYPTPIFTQLNGYGTEGTGFSL